MQLGFDVADSGEGRDIDGWLAGVDCGEDSRIVAAVRTWKIQLTSVYVLSTGSKNIINSRPWPMEPAAASIRLR